MKIFVIGCGGIGSQLLVSLTRYLASNEEKIPLVFVDGDKYDAGNESRQEFASQLIGTNKAEATRILYDAKYGNKLKLEAVQEYVGKDNVGMIGEKSIVLSCVDNHVCRNLLSKHCQTLKDVILISGGNSEKLDGNVQLFVRENGENKTATLEDRHPEIATTDDGDRAEMSCEELAKIPGGNQVVMANALAGVQMSVAVFNFLNDHKGIEGVDEIYFDGYSLRTRRIKNGIPE